MKKIITITIFIYSTLFAQGITNTLGGKTAEDRFIVENSDFETELVVTGEGNVGFGINDPATKFHLYDGQGNFTGTNWFALDAIIESSGNAMLEFNGVGDCGITFADDGASIRAGILYNTSTDHIQFRTGGTSNRVSILENGNVGINVSTPNYKLEVGGPANLNSGITTGSPLLFANNSEAIWFDGNYFSWGYGGSYNVFYNKVGIGTGASEPAYKLEVRDSNGGDNQTYGNIALFKNTNTTGFADGIRIEIGPTSNTQAQNAFLWFHDGDGSPVGYVSGDNSGGVLYSTMSDGRLKMNISEFENALDMIDDIKVKEYEMISSPGIKQIGLIAQELKDIYPQAVSGSQENDVSARPMGIDYSRLTPLLVQAIQELQARIEELEGK